MVRFAAPFVLLLLVAATAPQALFAQSTADICTPRPPDYRIPDVCQERPRVRAHEPIYAIWQWTESDQDAARLNYSVRYTFFGPECYSRYRAETKNGALMPGKSEAERQALIDEVRNCILGNGVRSEWFVSYTGQFDFYMNSRDSGPVVNRISNPGFHYRRNYRQNHRPEEPRWYGDLGIEHRSNGQTSDPHEQVFDPASGGLRNRAQLEDERGNRAHIDSISQDTNYIVLEAFVQPGEWVDLWLRVKPLYFSNDTAVTWGPRAGQDLQMWDYDRVRLSAAYTFGRRDHRHAERMRVAADWTVGDKGFATDSMNLSLYLPVKVWKVYLPFFFHLHLGPLHTLSDFTREQNSFGVGFLLLE